MKADLNLDFLNHEGITSFNSDYNADNFLNHLLLAKHNENKLRKEKGLENSLNTVHHLPLHNIEFLKLCLKSDVLELCSKYFKENIFLHSCNACLSNQPSYKSYVNNFHRDTTCFFGKKIFF